MKKQDTNILVKSTRSFSEIQHAKKRAFLVARCVSTNKSEAARKSKVDRSTYWHWEKEDREFCEALAEAEAISAHRMEEMAGKLAFEGWLEPVYHEGKCVGHKTKFSPTLIMFMVNGALPEKYVHRHEIHGELRFAKVIEEADWFGHGVSDHGPKSIEASDTDSGEPGEVQDIGVREKVGKDGLGPNGSPSRSRAD